MIPFGHKDESKEQRAIFHAACTRIAARFETNNRLHRWFVDFRRQQATQRSIAATQKAIEGINRHREIL